MSRVTDISCPDRVCLNGYVRGKPIASPALPEPIGEKSRKDVANRAKANGVPLAEAGQSRIHTGLTCTYEPDPADSVNWVLG